MSGAYKHDRPETLGIGVSWSLNDSKFAFWAHLPDNELDSETHQHAAHPNSPGQLLVSGSQGGCCHFQQSSQHGMAHLRFPMVHALYPAHAPRKDSGQAEHSDKVMLRSARHMLKSELPA